VRVSVHEQKIAVDLFLTVTPWLLQRLRQLRQTRSTPVLAPSTCAKLRSLADDWKVTVANRCRRNRWLGMHYQECPRSSCSCSIGSAHGIDHASWRCAGISGGSDMHGRRQRCRDIAQPPGRKGQTRPARSGSSRFADEPLALRGRPPLDKYLIESCRSYFPRPASDRFHILLLRYRPSGRDAQSSQAS